MVVVMQPATPNKTAPLLADYAEVSLAQYDAEMQGDTRRFNRLFDRLMEVERRLASLPEGLNPLDAILEHQNPRVRLNAAKVVSDSAPESARRAIESVQALGRGPQALDAGMFLSFLDGGALSSR
jgi:hypothetical protein